MLLNVSWKSASPLGQESACLVVVTTARVCLRLVGKLAGCSTRVLGEALGGDLKRVRDLLEEHRVVGRVADVKPDHRVRAELGPDLVEGEGDVVPRLTLVELFSANEPHVLA